MTGKDLTEPAQTNFGCWSSHMNTSAYASRAETWLQQFPPALLSARSANSSLHVLLFLGRRENRFETKT